MTRRPVRSRGDLRTLRLQFQRFSISADDAYEFLVAALPQLLDFERQLRPGATPTDPPPAPPALSRTKLWRQFQKEREEILKHKYCESQRAGHDIGMEQAIRDWLEKHAPQWHPDPDS